MANGKRSSQQLEAPPASKRRAIADTQPYDLFRDTSLIEFATQYVQETTFRTLEGSYYGPTDLKKHQPEIVQLISLPELVPYLIRHELLTDRENEILQNNIVPHHDRVLNLLRFIEKKGPDGYEKFLQALKEETSHLGHRQVVKLLTATTQASSSSSPGPEIGSTYVPKRYETLRDVLKGVYTNEHFYRRAAGPHVGKIEFVHLALVKNQWASEDEKLTDHFLKSTLHGLVDDIEKKKKPIEIQKIFQYGKSMRKLVLVEGASGVGKTMLAMKLCEDWANEEAYMKEFELVILVPLRQFHGGSEITVEDLARNYLGKNMLASEVSQELIKSGGEKVLFILEGWDELSPNLRQEFTFFFDIIMANQLSQASVMVTSRPTVTAPLYDYMDERRIEVLGFNKTQKQQYVHTHVPDKAAMVLDHLKKFPNLNALAHIPLALAIICHMVKHTNKLPPTLTELYDGYLCKTLLPNLKRQPVKEFKTLWGITSLKDLPGEAQAIFRKLGQLALQGFKEKAFVFYAKDLENAGLNPSEAFDGYGLLSTPIKAAKAGHQLLYQFRHLSIQEFLAALQIQELRNDDRIHLLREYHQDKQFQNVWRFFSGITKLQDEELRKLIISGTGLSNRDQLFLLHCVFEAHNTKICHAAAEKLNHTLNLNNMTLNTTDCLCAAYTIANAGGEWNIDLRGCNIGADGLEVFKQNLTGCGSSKLKVATLNLVHNHIDPSAASHLAEMIKDNVHFRRINLGSNKIEDESALILAEALATNETVKSIHFDLDPIGDRGVTEMASALKHNKSLIDISLTSTEMGIGGLKKLAEMLRVNRTLEVIRLCRNNLAISECQVVADIIAHNDKLVLIEVLGCEITGKALPKLVEFFAMTETFEIIQLGCNNLGDDGAEHIACALSLNATKSVKQVLLENTGMSKKGKNLLAEVCKSRENLDVNFTHLAQIVHEKNMGSLPKLDYVGVACLLH